MFTTSSDSKKSGKFKPVCMDRLHWVGSKVCRVNREYGRISCSELTSRTGGSDKRKCKYPHCIKASVFALPSQWVIPNCTFSISLKSCRAFWKWRRTEGGKKQYVALNIIIAGVLLPQEAGGQRLDLSTSMILFSQKTAPVARHCWGNKANSELSCQDLASLMY